MKTFQGGGGNMRINSIRYGTFFNKKLGISFVTVNKNEISRTTYTFNNVKCKAIILVG